MTLIVGSDSIIGGALMKHLQLVGERIGGTTRRREMVDEFHLYLDLSEDVEGWKCPWPVDVAVICAGVSKLEDCRKDPKTSALINVIGVSQLVELLVRRGVFVIYLSTNQVFDGSVPFRLPDDPVSPRSEYGRQKAIVEMEISKYGDSVSIVRPTKVMNSKPPLYVDWIEKLKSGKTIHPFSDMFMAPVPLGFVVNVIQKVIEKRLSGILQISGKSEISYAQAAYWCAERFGYCSELVKPIKVEESDLEEIVPRNTTLNIERLVNELGCIPPDIGSVLESSFESVNSLSVL